MENEEEMCEDINFDCISRLDGEESDTSNLMSGGSKSLVFRFNYELELQKESQMNVRFMGLENEGMCIKTRQIGGNLRPSNLPGSAGEIGLGAEGTEKDYREFTLSFPTIKYPGSYAFTVAMWNGISE